MLNVEWMSWLGLNLLSPAHRLLRCIPTQSISPDDSDHECQTQALVHSLRTLLCNYIDVKYYCLLHIIIIIIIIIIIFIIIIIIIVTSE